VVLKRRGVGKCPRRKAQRKPSIERRKSDVERRFARLQNDEFIAAADSNIELIAAGTVQIDLIGTTRVGKSAAKGPRAQRRDGYQRRPAPRSLQRRRRQAPVIVCVGALTPLGVEQHSPAPK